MRTWIVTCVKEYRITAPDADEAFRLLFTDIQPVEISRIIACWEEGKCLNDDETLFATPEGILIEMIRIKKMTKHMNGDIVSYEVVSERPAPESGSTSTAKNEHAVVIGRLGGLKGGHARSASLSPERRSEIASKAATRRWEREQSCTARDDHPLTITGKLAELIGSTLSSAERQVWWFNKLKHRMHAGESEAGFVDLCNALLDGSESQRDIGRRLKYKAQVITKLFPILDRLNEAKHGQPITCGCGRPTREHRGLCAYREGLRAGDSSRDQSMKRLVNVPNTPTERSDIAFRTSPSVQGNDDGYLPPDTPEARQEKARKAAQTRWGHQRPMGRLLKPVEARPIGEAKAKPVKPDIPVVVPVTVIPKSVRGEPKKKAKSVNVLDDVGDHSPAFRHLRGQQGVCPSCHCKGGHYRNCVTQFIKL